MTLFCFMAFKWLCPVDVSFKGVTIRHSIKCLFLLKYHLERDRNLFDTVYIEFHF